MKRIIKAMALCGTTLLFAHAAVCQDADILSESASNDSIANIIYNGSGCPNTPSSLMASAVDVDDDGLPDVLRFHFLSYKAVSRQNCSIRLILDHPPGWRYGIVSGRFVGDAHLPAGAVGKIESIYEFLISEQAVLSIAIPGPYAGVYRRGDTVDPAEIVWSRCGDSASTLSLDTQLLLAGNLSSASISSNWQIYWLRWRKCS